LGQSSKRGRDGAGGQKKKKEISVRKNAEWKPPGCGVNQLGKGNLKKKPGPMKWGRNLSVT